ncbi:MAG: hypothetical protein RIR70_1313, partial [Pseudomonadota bacterium]
EQGDAEGLMNLGVKYAKGQGVPQDYTFAYMLYNLAAASGHGGAVAARDEVMQRISKTQIERGQVLGSGWKPGMALPMPAN